MECGIYHKRGKRLADEREAFAVVAEAFGVEPEYMDNSGTIHKTPRHTALSILEAKGVDPGRALKDTSADLLTVCVDDLPAKWSISVQSPESVAAEFLTVTARLHSRDGRDLEFSFKPPEAEVDRLRAVLGHVDVSFPFPDKLEPGYYDVRIEAHFNNLTEVILISCHILIIIKQISYERPVVGNLIAGN